MAQPMQQQYTEAELMARQIAAKVDRLSENWLVFTGQEALDLMRKVQIFNSGGGKGPILCVDCERAPGFGAHTIEHFVPIGFAHAFGPRFTDISGSLGSDPVNLMVRWSPDKPWDKDGWTMSCVYTLRECFPRKELDAIKLAKLD